MKSKNNIPVYSLNEFSKLQDKSKLFQVEVFDANRHFNVQYPHRHDFYEVLFLSKGSGYHIIDSNKYEIKPPCIFFMSPGQTHKLELSNDIDGYILLFTTEFYLINKNIKNRLLEYPFFFSVEQKTPPLSLVNEEDNKFIKSLFIRGIDEITKNHYSEEIICSLLDLILLSCDQLYPEENVGIRKRKGHIIVKKFLLLIEENYQRNLRINNYAEKLAITPNHLTQVVKEITGRTSISILREKQIAEIKRLLIHTNMNITEIADLMSFEDQSYFTKYFKKATGISPIKFREKSMKIT